MQKLALLIIYPYLSHSEALWAADMVSLYEGRQARSKALFDQIVKALTNEETLFPEMSPRRANEETFAEDAQCS